MSHERLDVSPEVLSEIPLDASEMGTDDPHPEATDAEIPVQPALPEEDVLDRDTAQDAESGGAEENGEREDDITSDGESSISAPVSVAGEAPAHSTAETSAAQTEKHQKTPPEMTFTAHLNELRIRLVRCISGAFVGFLLCYGFAEQLFNLLMEPLANLLEPSGGFLIYTGLAEAFFTHVKVAAIAGLFVASPYVFYQIWMFIAPGLYSGERKYIIPIALCSAICFVTGALFGYFVVFPVGFKFFLGYATDFVKPLPSVKEYFSFSTGMLFAFGFIFELPLFMVFLSSLGIVTYKTLRKHRKYAILGSFIVGAILTPPDVVSQCLMAAPLCLLYEVGIWAAYVFGKKPQEAAQADGANPEAPSA